MTRALNLIAIAAFALSLAGAADAKQCRDAKGKFIKCPAPVAQQCRDTKTGKFAKCGTPGAVPVKK